MTKYYLKITRTPTSKNIFHNSKTEYYVNMESPISSFCEPTDEDLKVFGFGNFKAAENIKKQKEKIYSRDDKKFNTWIHAVEIKKRDFK